MHPSLSAYLSFLDHAKVRFASSPTACRLPDHDGPLISIKDSPRELTLEGLPPVLEHFSLEEGIGADHATFSVAGILREQHHGLKGLTVAEVGCGTGVLSIIAAGLGARVIACDVDSRALELASANARENRVEVDFRHGSLLAPLMDLDQVDVFIANLPHKPGTPSDGLPISQAGGTEGDALWVRALDQMRALQRPGGQLLCYLHSLPHPRLLQRMQEDHDLVMQSWKLRWLGDREYGSFREVLVQRDRARTSFLARANGRIGMVGIAWQGIRTG